MARRLLRAIRGQVLHLDYPRRAAARLAPFDDAAPNHAQRRHNAHTYALCYSFKGQLSPRDPLAVAVDGNAMVTAERAHPRFGPAIAAPGRLAGAIEEPRNLLVGHQARQLADQR